MNMVGGAIHKHFFTSLVVLACSVFSSVVVAQIDPASEMLLDNTSRQSSLDNGLDSGRYTVRPKATPKKVAPASTPTPVPAPAPAPAQTPSQTATQAPTPTATVDTTPAPSATPQVSVTASPSPAPTATATPEVAAATSPTPVPSPAPLAAPEVAKQERQKLSSFDRRTQLLELSLSPVYLYNHSQSSYWYRSYYMASPGAHLNANVWLTDSLGLHTSFLTSLSASVTDSIDQSRVAAATQNWFDIGLRFRHFASDKPKSSALVLGIDWSEYRFNASTSAMMRDRLKTSGAQVTGGIEYPSSKHYMWTADVSLIPKAKHEELETQAVVKSGTSNETNAFGVSLGGVIRIDASDAYFWRISHKVEKNVFSGAASAADPLSGITPNGVSVTNSTTFFEIGCTWGN